MQIIAASNLNIDVTRKGFNIKLLSDYENLCGLKINLDLLLVRGKGLLNQCTKEKGIRSSRKEGKRSGE